MPREARPRRTPAPNARSADDLETVRNRSPTRPLRRRSSPTPSLPAQLTISVYASKSPPKGRETIGHTCPRFDLRATFVSEFGYELIDVHEWLVHVHVVDANVSLSSTHLQHLIQV